MFEPLAVGRVRVRVAHLKDVTLKPLAVGRDDVAPSKEDDVPRNKLDHINRHHDTVTLTRDLQGQQIRLALLP